MTTIIMTLHCHECSGRFCMKVENYVSFEVSSTLYPDFSLTIGTNFNLSTSELFTLNA